MRFLIPTLLLFACTRSLPPLEIEIQGRRAVVDPSGLQRDAFATISVHDPYLAGPATYDAIELTALLSQFAPDWQKEGRLLFKCADGYLAEVSVADLKPRQAFLAFNRPGEEFHLNNAATPISLSPYYLIWSGDSPATAQGRPWPYQVLQIRITALAPEPLPNAPPPVRLGERLFRQKCQSCHQLGGIGGSVGPELHRPVNVTRYWKTSYLEQWIANPSAIRQGARMPAFSGELSAKEIGHIVRYLEYLDRQGR
ncbi:MAG: cytochrome c [Spirochaetales bacterium]|nr:cytochrome c [Spirochaetales bacterium]